MTPTQIARVCHEANRALQQMSGEVVNFPWENTSVAMRDSDVDGVEGVLAGNTPRESHENWVRYKTAEGWTYGEVKDFAAKTHPCLVDYDDLPEDQRVKDALFGAIVNALR